jgi:hypothetical protein
VHFQDFNAEVLRCLTIPNVKRNLSKQLPQLGFFAGDWSQVHDLLLCAGTKNQVEDDGSSCGGYDLILMAETVYDISSLSSLYHLIKKVDLGFFKVSSFLFTQSTSYSFELSEVHSTLQYVMFC